MLSGPYRCCKHMQCLSSRVSVIPYVELHRARVAKVDLSRKPCTEIVCHAKESINSASNAVFTGQVGGRDGPL